MSSSIERISRETGGSVDVESLKRKSWSGFSAEFVKIPGPALYDFKVRGSWAHLFLFDLHRTDGETIVGGAPRSLAKDLRNKMIFAPPGHAIDGWCALEKAGVITTLAISPDIQFEHGVNLDHLPPRLVFEDEMLRACLRRFQALLAEPSSDGPGYAETIVELISFDLCRISGMTPVDQSPVGALDSQQVRMLTEHIDSHLSERLLVAELAALVNLTRFHFMRSFKLAVGLPAHQYVITRRIQRAQELLTSGDRPIATVAIESGFGTPIQLARAFRRMVGTTPSEYRRYYS